MKNIGISCSELRHLVNVESKVITSTGDRGQPVYSWQTYQANVWVKITPGLPPMVGGRKLELANQLMTRATHTITLRYVQGLTFDMRFNWVSTGRIFNVVFVANTNELNYEMVAVCIEQKLGG